MELPFDPEAVPRERDENAAEHHILRYVVDAQDYDRLLVLYRDALALIAASPAK